MKIGLLTTSFPRAPGDPAGHFVLGFAEALAARGHPLHVLAPEPHERAFETPPTFHDVDIEVEWVRYLPRTLERTFYGAGVLDNLTRDPRALVGVAPYLVALSRATVRAARDWDAVVSHWALPCALIAGELARGLPHLAVLHSADVFLLEQLPPPLARTLATRIASRSSALLCTSRALRRRFLALLAPIPRGEAAARAHVCPMGIHPAAPSRESRAALRSRLGLDGFTILSLGRLIPLKGLHHAIDASARIDDAQLVIAGYGPERASLERQAMHSPARVRFVGTVRGEDKSAWLHAADAFVLPSVRLRNGRTEGVPHALLEAMEHGLPVVASDVGGISDVIESGVNGLLVPPDDPAALTAALASLRDPALRQRLAEGARATAALYHWSAIAPRLEQLLTGEETGV